MIIIGFDVGKRGGIAINRDGELEGHPFNFVSYVELYDELVKLFEQIKPDGCITGKPNRLYNIIMSHAPYIGIIGLVCERFGIPLVIESDSTIRAFILGKGNGKRKDLVHEKYKGETPDVSDAMMFTDWFFKKQ